MSSDKKTGNAPRDLASFRAAIVTGGSAGMGAAFIKAISGINAEVAVCNLSRRIPSLSSSQIRLRHLPVNLAVAAEVQAAIPQILAWLDEVAPEGPLLLVNNAGFGSFGPFPAPDANWHDNMIAVNLAAPVRLTTGLLPILKERSGAIINIASTAAFAPTPYMATYAATKAFNLHWSLALHEELKDSGVQVVTVCPGQTRTEFGIAAQMKEGFAKGVPFKQEPEQVVRAAFRALRKGRTLTISGPHNRLVTIFARLIPLSWTTRAARQVMEKLRWDRRE